MEYSDDDLAMYLAGDMPAEDAARLEALLETDGDLERRMMALEPLAAPLQSVFQPLPDAARLPEALPPARPVQRRFVSFGLVAAAACCLGVGLAALMLPDRDLTWQEQVAIYQKLYVEETVATLTPTPDLLRAQFDRASSELGLPLDPETYADLPGLTLKRAQILGLDGNPLIQVAFAADTGAPIAFCITRENSDAAAVMTELSGLPTVHWSENGFGYMLIGELPRDQLAALARSLGAAL